MKKFLIGFAFTLSCAFAAQAEMTMDWTIGPFDMPESAIFDQAGDRIIVSVIKGHPGEADGEGGLSLVSTDGKMLNADWVTGLDAPKGMAIIGGTLLVADLKRLHEINLETGNVMRSVEVDEAIFLNDITSDGKRAYISDFMGNRIWRYESGEITPWLTSDALSHPNGVLLDGDRLLIGSWGKDMKSDFSTETPGSLLTIDLSTKQITSLAADIGNLDGVVRIDDAILVNDWMNGQLFEVGKDGSVTIVKQFESGLADIASDGNTLFLPSMLEGTVSAKRYPFKEENGL